MHSPRVEFMNGMDERLKFVLDSVKKAVEMFLEASKGMEYACRFKAFEIVDVSENDKNALSEVIKEAFAIEIAQQAKATLENITYGYFVEPVEGEDKKYSFWFSAMKEKPEYPEQELAVVEEKEDESSGHGLENITLPHASGMPAYKRPGSE